MNATTVADSEGIGGDHGVEHLRKSTDHKSTNAAGSNQRPNLAECTLHTTLELAGETSKASYSRLDEVSLTI